MMRIAVAFMLWVLLCPAAKAQTKPGKYNAYLFVYFTGNSKHDEAIKYAISTDGYNFKALNVNKPIVSSATISETGGVRDPHILRGADGKTFYMVITDMVSAKGWDSNRGMVLMKSTDLINWTSAKINLQKKYAGQDSLLRVWAPQTIYDAAAKKYMVYFSLKYGKQPDKIYYAYANKDFTDIEGEPKQLFFHPEKAACIDGDIVGHNNKFYLFFKTEDQRPGIKVAVSDNLTSGYKLQSNEYVQQTDKPVEGAGTFKLNNDKGYILMYDMYTSGRYQFTYTTDLKNFRAIDNQVSMDFNPRHGTVMPVTDAEATRLTGKYLSAKDVIKTVQAKGLKVNNVSIDTLTNTLLLPFLPGTDLSKVQLNFSKFPGATIAIKTPVNLSKSAVVARVSMAGQKPVDYKVMAVKYNNPVLTGYYADPDILYANKTGKFYLYPTTDGFKSWGGTYFKTFSSTDLVNWKDEGKILDLETDVSWAKRNAWAPCIVEKKIDGAYKYFYYFCAAQKIGVAVSDNPTGPFKDSGKPLIDKFPEGITRGQNIDPDVFTDPQTGKSYLYWGNSYMAGAELNGDMISLKTSTTTVLTPDKSFREGVYVFYRNGKYYFMWSVDDTRSENYHVRYGVADSPLGKITIPENNVVIIKDKTKGIYGTGHNSVLQLPGQDKWYMVYHRFNYPNGINMGDAAGWYREVCIDELQFNPDSSIKQVIPTQQGIAPVKVSPVK